MKKIIGLYALLILFYSCGTENKNNSHSTNSNAQEEHYLNYDFELDKKSTAEVDTAALRIELNKILSPKRIVELFGSGFQTFYLLLKINPDGTSSFKISPEAGSWLTGWSRFERGLFKENLELSNDYAIIPSNTGDSKAVNVKDIFLANYSLKDKNIFKTTAGLLNGKLVQSGKAFQIDISLLDNGKVVNPWNIKEIDLSNFKPHFTESQTREYYFGYFPAVLKSDYKFLKDRIEFPKLALDRKVNGKVFVKIFIEENGDYAGYQLIKGLGYGIDEEVIKAIEDSKISGYPTGEKTSIILPFNFGINKQTAVDVYVKSFEFNPKLKKGNNLVLIINNKMPVSYSNNTKFEVIVFIDNELAFRSIMPSLNWDKTLGMIFYFPTHRMKPYPGDKTGRMFLPGDEIKPGEHEYKISIDPEGVLNDVDRSNNIVRGKLVIK